MGSLQLLTACKWPSSAACVPRTMHTTAMLVLCMAVAAAGGGHMPFILLLSTVMHGHWPLYEWWMAYGWCACGIDVLAGGVHALYQQPSMLHPVLHLLHALPVAVVCGRSARGCSLHAVGCARCHCPWPLIAGHPPRIACISTAYSSHGRCMRRTCSHIRGMQ